MTPSETPDSDLTPEERLRLQNELTISELETEFGATFGFPDADNLTPEMEAEFLQRIKDVEGGGRGEYVTIGSLMEGADYLPFEEAAARYEAGDKEVGRGLVEHFEKLMLERGLFCPQPEWMVDMSFYRFLTHDFLEHRVPAPPPAEDAPVGEDGSQLRHMIGVMYEHVRQDSPEDLAYLTEAFVFHLLSPNKPFPAEMLADQCRLGPELASREEIVAHIERWWSRWSRIAPLGFQPDEVIFGPDGAMYAQFACAYDVVDRQTGEETHYEGPGLVQVAIIGKRFQVVGCSMEGFEM